MNKRSTSSSVKRTLILAARASPLSRAQVAEMEAELDQQGVDLNFTYVFVETTGDRDLATSLRTKGKDDFFTKEIDDLLLRHQCDIAVHSAKDLPDPLPQGLQIIALTRGVDASDSLVLHPGQTLASLPKGAVIATSSHHREERVRSLRQDLAFVDLRGTIGDRLAKLDRGEVDGVVVATAALIRLKLMHLNAIRLPGKTTAGQGQLAILARDDEIELHSLFKPLDSRQ